MAKLLVEEDRCMVVDCRQPAIWKVSDVLLCNVCLAKLFMNQCVELVDGSIRLGEFKRVRTIG